MHLALKLAWSGSGHLRFILGQNNRLLENVCAMIGIGSAVFSKDIDSCDRMSEEDLHQRRLLLLWRLDVMFFDSQTFMVVRALISFPMKIQKIKATDGSMLQRNSQ